MTDHDRQDEVLRLPRSRAAHGMRPAMHLFMLTLLGTVDGTLVVLAATGGLSTWSGALAIGLTVIAGAGSWVAAREAVSRVDRRAVRMLGVLGCVTVAATVLSVWLGTHLGAALGLHILPKATGLALVLLGLEMSGLRLPTRLPIPVVLLGGALVAEVAWSLS